MTLKLLQLLREKTGTPQSKALDFSRWQKALNITRCLFPINGVDLFLHD